MCRGLCAPKNAATLKEPSQHTLIRNRLTDGVGSIPPYDGKTTVTAFKPGFRMLVGDAGLRERKGMQKQLCHRCLGAGYDRGGAPCTGSDSPTLPDHFCEGGIRTTVTFPTCWDGKNIDSPDHKSHVAYPEVGTFESVGTCPDSHPVRLPQLMYEVMWDVRIARFISLFTS